MPIANDSCRVPLLREDALSRAQGDAVVPFAQSRRAAGIDGAAAILATLPAAALLLASDGRIVARNGAADTLLRDAPVFIDVERRLRGRTPTVNRRIRDAVRQSLCSGFGRVLRIVDFGPLGDVVVSIAPTGAGPVPDTAGDGRDGVAAVVQFLSDSSGGPGIASALGALYRLSDLEAEMAYAIYCGDSTADFALAHRLDAYTAALVRDRTLKRMRARGNADVVRRVSVVVQMSPATPDRTVAAAGAPVG